MNRYRVAPFSGPKYQKNFSSLRNNEQGCAICGKPLAQPYQHAAAVVHGGSDWASSESEANDIGDPGHMGTWWIGPDCHRKHLIR